ncbi:MAG: sulfatase [Pirellulales bacterium]
MQTTRFFRCIALLLLAQCACTRILSAAEKPNLLIITVDDMNADSLGSYGCPLEGTSPSIDSFAKEAIRFKHAHVQVGNCMPGRNIMWSGMFSHANGVEGFVQNQGADYPVLCDLAKDAGYFTGIRGKVSHSTPYTPYAWDAVLDSSPQGKPWHLKDAQSYGTSTRQGIALAKAAGKPFCLLINISDPHKPFYAQAKQGQTFDDSHVPSRVFSASEVPVPGFLPEDPVIRQELAHYYSSVRRADDCFAEVMKALEDSRQADNTLVMFLSDHGMPLPFAKTQLYHHSTRTPLMIRWPGVTEPGSTDENHMVSAIDFLPTLLDVIGHQHPQPERLHGRSFAPLLRGETQDDRDFVILQYNENAGRNRHPMRGIQTREYLYLYNPWSNGKRKFATATTGTMTYRQMVKRATSEPEVAARLELFDHRVLEELYDVEHDPDCLVNRMDDSELHTTVQELRGQLAQALTEMGDPVAPLLTEIDDPQLREDYMRLEDVRMKKPKKRER